MAKLRFDTCFSAAKICNILQISSILVQKIQIGYTPIPRIWRANANERLHLNQKKVTVNCFSASAGQEVVDAAETRKLMWEFLVCFCARDPTHAGKVEQMLVDGD